LIISLAVSIKTRKVLLVSDPTLIDRLNHNMVDKAIKKYLYDADKVFTFDDKNPHTNNKVVIYIHQ
jgi:type III secretion system FlhB-like substrate exporter